MKKLLVLLLTFGFFVTACNNNKNSKNQNLNNRDKDDYGKNENRNNNDEKKNDGNTGNTGNDNNNSMAGSWSSTDINAFVSTCVSNAVQGGMSQELSQKYCSCMQQKFEQMYPDSKDAGNITEEQMNTPSMMAMVKGCLTGN